MSHRLAIPLAAGLAAAAIAFAVVLLATDRGGATSVAANAPAAPAPSRGRLVFARVGCGSCHTLAAAGSHGIIGPSLDDALAHHTPASLRAKVSRPGIGSVMPQDFARRMSPADLDALVAFLIAARPAG
jgi:mono/diheme cytochrome c family protein